MRKYIIILVVLFCILLSACATGKSANLSDNTNKIVSRAEKTNMYTASATLFNPNMEEIIDVFPQFDGAKTSNVNIDGTIFTKIIASNGDMIEKVDGVIMYESSSNLSQIFNQIVYTNRNSDKVLTQNELDYMSIEEAKQTARDFLNDFGIANEFNIEVFSLHHSYIQDFQTELQEEITAKESEYNALYEDEKYGTANEVNTELKQLKNLVIEDVYSDHGCYLVKLYPMFDEHAVTEANYSSNINTFNRYTGSVTELTIGKNGVLSMTAYALYTNIETTEVEAFGSETAEELFNNSKNSIVKTDEAILEYTITSSSLQYQYITNPKSQIIEIAPIWIVTYNINDKYNSSFDVVFNAVDGKELITV